MAERRMFSKSVIGSARFLRMPPSSRLLYYDLGMAADDDGVVEAFSVMRMTGAVEDDLKVLVSKGFITVLNEDLVAYIEDWSKNNQIRKDRYQPSIYQNLLVQIGAVNQLETVGQPDGNQRLTQDKGTLSIEHIYDYLIVDEASQVDLATGVLAFSCARNIVIIGDLKQLPNVLTEDDIRTSDAIWQRYSLDERYRFSTHSLLSSALEIWQDAPVTLLREHYRCHPKIINFCNQKFYHGKLIVMTKDHDEPNVLAMYRTTAGNHARGHLNQRQIDVIQQEVLPRLHQQNFESIGIITPYRDQVTAIRRQLGDTYAVDTVHKFQGREQDAIILTSVDNVITDFVDDPHMLNVAVSRAVHSLAVVTSQDPRNDRTNYGDLMRYIEYNNFEVIQSHVYSVFDMLYQGYAEQRKIYLQKHKRVSEYDSENLMYALIQEVLSEEAFSSIGCAVHVSLATLVKSYEPLTKEERQYARNPLTHVDFLLFNQMDKQPVLAIEVDGTGFHEAGSNQAARDMKKNSILEKCAVPLLRLRTDGSGEKEKIRNALKRE